MGKLIFIVSLNLLLCTLMFSGLPIEDVNLSKLLRTIQIEIYKIVDGEFLLMNIYMPLENEYDKAPVLIYFHGGRWLAGSRGAVNDGRRSNLVEALRNMGYAVISVDYRLLRGDFILPDNIVDCKDAVRFVHSISSEYGFDSSNIGLWGTSAGGYLALSVAYSEDTDYMGDPSLAGFSSQVNYVVDYFGPTDLVDIARDQSEEMLRKMLPIYTGIELTDETEEDILDILSEHSPINKIENNAVKTLIIHGEKDRIVPIKQSKALVSAFEEQNIGDQVEFIAISDAAHCILVDGRVSNKTKQFVIEKTIEFILEQYHQK